MVKGDREFVVAAPMVRRAAQAIVVAGSLTVLAACGGGSSDASSTTEKPVAKTTTTKPEAKGTTTTEAPKVPESDLTKQGILTTEDLGGEWEPYPPDKEIAESASKGCSDVPGADIADEAVARSTGDLQQRGEFNRWASADAYEFADEATASAFVKTQLSDPWIECVRAGAEKTWKPTGDNRSVSTFGVERRPDTGSFRGQYSISFDEKASDGKTYSGGDATHLIYQFGPLVVDAFVQGSPKEGDPDDIYDTTFNQVVEAMDAVAARVDPSGGGGAG